MTAVPPDALSDDPRQWVSFDDPAGQRTWIFDVTFLRSRWTCIYGRGCPGIREPDPGAMIGCCTEGVSFQSADELARVEAAAAQLGPDEWQFHRPEFTQLDEDGWPETLTVDDACIFLNRPGFAAGAGCALHLAALSRSEPPHHWKPDLCWQLPLKVDDHMDDEFEEHVTTVVRRLEDRHFGDSAQWWCTEDPLAHVGDRPVYEAVAEELEALAGPEVAGALLSYLRALPADPVPAPVALRRRASAPPALPQ